MEAKYLTKMTLMAVNNQAKKAGGNHIDPDFVKYLPDRFKFPVCMALPFASEKGWVRCWVTLSADDPVVSDNIHALLVDMPLEALAKLPSFPEAAQSDDQ